ncbi:7689_t:CDS:2 [Racocetra fulgida]|uniref:7689_t:CDS:1 n=1 Tax=Racocetra fulgida TaxID=60492 RepID=A0A9N8W406_9GLOM|nr:7689_t:CDS:2 [Racocetra fulgida]
MNIQDPDARNLLYAEFPLYYTWNKSKKVWKRRKRGGCIRRIYMVHPNENFDDLKTVDGVVCTTFKESAQQRGFLKNDDHHCQCLNKAREFQMPNQIRNLFATLLIFEDLTDLRQLWNENFSAMAKNFALRGIPERQHQIQAVLRHINQFLQRHSKTVTDYNLPELMPEHNSEELPMTLIEELSYQIDPEELAKADILNEAQCAVFAEVMGLISRNEKV